MSQKLRSLAGEAESSAPRSSLIKQNFFLFLLSPCLPVTVEVAGNDQENFMFCVKTFRRCLKPFFVIIT